MRMPVTFRRATLPAFGQEKGLWDVLKYFRNRPSAPPSGTLIDIAKPSAADFERAFPLVPPNYAALSDPPSE